MGYQNPAGHPLRYVDPPLDEYLEAISQKGTPKATVEYYRRIYTAIREGRTAIVSPDVEQVTGRRPRSFSAFIEENGNAWRRESARL